MANVNSFVSFGHWRSLYISALFETDSARLPVRIAEAEYAIVARARELFSSSADTIEEGQALDDALYSLRALQSCLELRSTTHLGPLCGASQWAAVD
jgi:hypothetical protein